MSCILIRQILANYLPDSRQIDSKIIVHQDVSKSRNSTPLYIGMLPLQFIRESLRTLSQDLQIPQRGVLKDVGGFKSLLASLSDFFNPANAFGDVQ